MFDYDTANLGRSCPIRRDQLFARIEKVGGRSQKVINVTGIIICHTSSRVHRRQFECGCLLVTHTKEGYGVQEDELFFV